MAARWRLTVEFEAAEDQFPPEWDWPQLLLVDDDVDATDWRTLRVTEVVPT